MFYKSINSNMFYFTYSNASSSASIRSSIFSVPMLRRIVEGYRCCSSSSSGLSWEWVVVAGCITNDFTSATLARSENILRWSMKAHASFSPPLMSKVKMLPAPLGYSFLYSSWSGCVGNDGWFTLTTFGCLAR